MAGELITLTNRPLKVTTKPHILSEQRCQIYRIRSGLASENPKLRVYLINTHFEKPIGEKTKIQISTNIIYNYVNQKRLNVRLIV